MPPSNKAEWAQAALGAFREKVPTASDEVTESMRVFSFTSAAVQEVELLGRMQQLISAALEGGEGYKAEGGLDAFIAQAQELVQEYTGKPGVPAELMRESRLKLIFQTNVRQAYGLAQWRVGMDKWHISHYPCWRFVRRPGAKVKRPLHERYENAVRLKTDWTFWAKRMNGRFLGGFEVPYAPFGFNSYMVLRPVSRQSALGRYSAKTLDAQAARDLRRSKFGDLLAEDYEAPRKKVAPPKPSKTVNPTEFNEEQRAAIRLALERLNALSEKYESRAKHSVKGGRIHIDYGHSGQPDKKG
ncbi:MAG: hypothetical protein ACI4OZ_05265 [Akkermansia sp.]